MSKIFYFYYFLSDYEEENSGSSVNTPTPFNPISFYLNLYPFHSNQSTISMSSDADLKKSIVNWLSEIEFKAKKEQLEEELSNKQKSTIKDSLEVDSVKQQGQSINSEAENEEIRLSNILQKRKLKMKKHKLKKLRKRNRALRKRLGKI